MSVSTIDWRKANVRMALSINLGWIGADRFYDGQILWGILKSLTLGGLGIWWAVDALYFSYLAGRAEPGRGWWWKNLRLGLGTAYGFLGIDRMYNGQVVWGIIKLITFGGLGVWWLIDNLYWANKAGKADPQRGWWWQHVRLALSVTFGYFGVDRAYNGQIGLAILKLVTLGGLGAWWIADAAYYAYVAGRRQST